MPWMFWAYDEDVVVDMSAAPEAAPREPARCEVGFRARDAGRHLPAASSVVTPSSR
jgi:hypothetical protein